MTASWSQWMPILGRVQEKMDVVVPRCLGRTGASGLNGDGERLLGFAGDNELSVAKPTCSSTHPQGGAYQMLPHANSRKEHHRFEYIAV